MRAKPFTFLRLGLFSAALGATAGFSACADAIHLDPPGTGGGVTHADGGTEAGTACRSNPDCTYPKPVCDTVAQACVECLVFSDCAAKPGTACSAGKCQCPNPNDPTTPLAYCGSPTPSCIDTMTSVDNCGDCGVACFGSCTGGKCPNHWSPTPVTGAPDARSHHVAVWTGAQMFVWGGKSGGTPLSTGGLYDPAKKTWTATSATAAPSARWDATAVWDDVDHVVIVWGGTDGSGPLGTGGRYDPAKNAWSPVSTTGAPEARTSHTAVWAKPLSGFPSTTAGMIVWGGTVATNATNPYGVSGDGAVYDAAMDSWVGPVEATGAPSPRTSHSAVWDSGLRMIVFGGLAGVFPMKPVPAGDTFGYVPAATGTWNMITGTGTPPGARYQQTALWDPTSMATLIWGGWDGTTYFGDGATLSATSTWTAIGTGGSMPEGRIDHSAVIVTPSAAKSQLIIFGGDDKTGLLDKGWTLDIQANAWSALPTPGPSARKNHTAVAAGSQMIVWGGDTAGGPTNSGGTYNAAP